MNTVFLFDVDGTLTPSRQKMTDTAAAFFGEWIKGKSVYFISGSDYEKLKEQIPKEILESVDGVFGCMGNTLHKKGQSVYEKAFIAPQSLWDMLESELKNTTYRSTFGNHIEERTGMINFSIVGRNAPLEERKKYSEWDKGSGERVRIATRINKAFEDIEAAVGGEISIDIYPKGWDKSQVLEQLPDAKYVFFGDRLTPGGNDYALAKALDKEKDSAYNVNSYVDTMDLLLNLYS